MTTWRYNINAGNQSILTTFLAAKRIVLLFRIILLRSYAPDPNSIDIYNYKENLPAVSSMARSIMSTAVIQHDIIISE